MRRTGRVMLTAHVALAAVVAVLLLPARVEAQYFGRNNPRYQRFDFQILKTDHFDIYHYPEEAEAAQMTRGSPSGGMRGSRAFSITRCRRGRR